MPAQKSDAFVEDNEVLLGWLGIGAMDLANSP